MTTDADGQPTPPLRLATLWCADCAAEHRKSPGKLGEVYAFADRVFFLASDPRYGRQLRHRRRSDPTWAGGPQKVGYRTDGVQSTDSLPAWCKHHGEGRVAGRDVLDWRSSLVVKLRPERK